MSTQINRRSLIQAAMLSPITGAPVLLKNAAASDDCLKPLWLQRRDLISALRNLDQAWADARSRLPDWCLPGVQYHNSIGQGIVGWPAARSPILLPDGRLLLRPSPKNLRQLFYEEIDSIDLDAARLNYQVRFSALRSRRMEQRLQERNAGLPRSLDWHAIEKDINNIERVIYALRPDANTAVARLLIAFQNQRNKPATGDGELLSHLRSVLDVYLADQIPNLSGYILEDLSTILEN